MSPKLEKLLSRIKDYIDICFTGRIRIEINLLNGNVTKVYLLPREEI
ncbi:MAG: hypothetical protein U9Q84_00500 [Thermodesulfobacteriota bacterium]|nr:hypothetical protein [Thermodesulfobacteriota bacterium]